MLLGVFLTLTGLNCSVGLLIKLVSEHEEGKTGLTGGPTIIDKSSAPAVKVFEGDGVRDIVDEAATVRAAVESVSQGLKFLLSGGVPNLERNNIIINNHVFLAEVSADGGLRISIDFAVEVLLEQGSLANAGVTQNDDFKEVFLACGGRHLSYY